MPKKNVHFSSESVEWATPQYLFDHYDVLYGFDLDVCATPENAKCARFFTKEDDALKQQWTGRCWMNPPYGRTMRRWMKKAYESALAGAVVVCLVPARTDTIWWHEYAMQGGVEFLRGRVTFGNAKYAAPFPSAIITFDFRERK